MQPEFEQTSNISQADTSDRHFPGILVNAEELETFPPFDRFAPFTPDLGLFDSGNGIRIADSVMFMQPAFPFHTKSSTTVALSPLTFNSNHLSSLPSLYTPRTDALEDTSLPNSMSNVSGTNHENGEISLSENFNHPDPSSNTAPPPPCLPLWHYDHVDGLKPAPHDGYSNIEGLDFCEIMQTVDEQSRQFWQLYEGPCVLIYVPYYSPTIYAGFTATLLQEEICWIFCSSTIKVAAPKFIDLGTGRIYPFLVSGMTPHQANIMIARKVWSTLKLTFIAIPFIPEATEYVMTINNLSLSANIAGQAAAAQVVRQGMLQDTCLLQYLQDNPDATNGSSPETILQDAVLSITAKAMNTRLNGPYFRIYMAPIFADQGHHRAFIRLITIGNYVSLSGTAICCPDFICNYCAGHDHPIDFCPLLFSNQVYSNAFQFNFAM